MITVDKSVITASSHKINVAFGKDSKKIFYFKCAQIHHHIYKIANTFYGFLHNNADYLSTIGFSEKLPSFILRESSVDFIKQ